MDYNTILLIIYDHLNALKCLLCISLNTYNIPICSKVSSNVNEVIISIHSFDAVVLFTSIASETSIFSYCSIFTLTHKRHHPKKVVDKIYHLH